MTKMMDEMALIRPEAITQTFAILAVRGAGKTNAARCMAERMFRSHMPFVAIDPVGSWWGLRAGRQPDQKGLAIPIFGGRHGDVPLDVSGAVTIADLIVEKRLSCVIDLTTFASEGDKKRFLLLFAQRLYQKNEDPLHLFLEEADDYIPQKPFRDEAQLLRAWENIVRRGRARGLGMTMITQRSAKINKDVLTQAETLIALRTTSPQDRAAVEAWVKYHGEKQDILESLASLANGEAWVWSPHYLCGVFRMQFPLSVTFDSGATPKDEKGRKIPATMADVDLKDLQSKMSSAIEKAKAEDPKQLQLELAKVRKELAAAQKAAEGKLPKGFRMQKVIERPIVTAAQQHHMEKQIGKINGSLRLIDQQIGQVRLTLDALWMYFMDVVRTPPVPQNSVSKTAEKPQKIVRKTAEGPGDSSLSQSLRRVLTALAQHSPVANVDRLAALAGYTVNGHFTNMLGDLRTRGFLTPARQFPLEITEAGLQALGSYEPLPTGQELRDFWLNKLSPSEGKILRVLFDEYPDPVEQHALAQYAGYTVNGHFTNMLGHLRTMGLITPARQPIKAMDYLMEE
jgi:hypothetical protein